MACLGILQVADLCSIVGAVSTHPGPPPQFQDTQKLVRHLPVTCKRNYWNSDRGVGVVALVRKRGFDMQGYQPALLATTAFEHSLRRVRRLILGSTTESNTCEQQQPLFASLKGVLLRSLSWWEWWALRYC